MSEQLIGEEIRIGELGRRAGISPKTIRYYEDAGLLPSPTRTDNGYRSYTEEDVRQLAFIRAAKDFGFTLGEIREILAVRDRDETPCPYVLGRVEARLSDLHARIQRLQELSSELTDMLRDFEEVPAGASAPQGEYCHVIENRRLGGRETK